MKDLLYHSESREPLIEKGDFVVGDSSEQEIESLIHRPGGATRESPRAGLGALRFLKSTGREVRFFRNLKDQLIIDQKGHYRVTGSIGDFVVTGSSRSGVIPQTIPEVTLQPDKEDPIWQEVTVGDGENIFSLAIRYYGSIEGALLLYQHNEGLNFQEDIAPGSTLLVDISSIIDSDVVAQFNRD